MTATDRRAAAPRFVAVATILAAAAAALGIVLIGRSSTMAFIVLALALLALAGFAALRWPRATLVLAALTTLLDPVVAPRLAPPGIELDVIGISEPLLATTGIFVFLGAVRRGGVRQALRDPTTPLVLAFVGISVVSAAVNATPPGVAAFGTLMTIDAIAAMFLWRMLRPSVGAAALAATGIVAGALVVAIVGIGQVLLLGYGSRGADGALQPMTSFLGNPNMVAMVLAFTAPFPIFGAVGLPTRRDRWLAGSAAFVILLCLAFTFSRGGWLAAGVGIGIGTLLLERRALLLAATLGLLAWVTVVVMPSGLLAAGADPMPTAPPASPTDAASSPQPAESPEQDPPVDPFKGMRSNEVRLLLLRDGLRIIDDHRLLGVGPGRYGGAAAAIVPSPVYAEYDTTLGRLRTVHNFWLHLAGEVGSLGVAVFLAMVVALGIRFVLSARTASGPRFVVLAGSASAVVAVIVHNFTEMGLEGNVPGILIWLTLGIGSTLAHASLRPAQHRRTDA